MPKAKLERGISRLPPVGLGDGSSRIPAVLIRSSPWKAGTPRTPWHDSFDAEGRTLSYFGDNKIDHVTEQVKEEDPADVLGNRFLLDAHWAHAADRAEERADGAPLLVFTGVEVPGRQKGNVRFDGLGVVTGARFVRQDDVLTSQAYRNLLFDIELLDLSGDAGRVDWAWISARRQAGGRRAADFAAPSAWDRWVRSGHDVSGRAPSRRRRAERPGEG